MKNTYTLNHDEKDNLKFEVLDRYELFIRKLVFNFQAS
jgi:hypothetical protein